jgi:hypothetical protein
MIHRRERLKALFGGRRIPASSGDFHKPTLATLSRNTVTVQKHTRLIRIA